MQINRSMDHFIHLRTKAAAANADRLFVSQPAILLKVASSSPRDMWTLQRATTFMVSRDRIGRARRTIYAARGEAVFEFEDAQDAAEFTASFEP